MSFHVPEAWRVKNGPYESDPSYGNNGLFIVRLSGKSVRCLASDGMEWDHVSVSIQSALFALNEPPSWSVMQKIKDLFWDAEDCVVQFHPPKSQYVNLAKNCLHLWRSQGIAIPQPPLILV